MFCNKCGAQLPDNATSCDKCSVSVSNTAQVMSQTKPKKQKSIIIGLSVAIVVLLIPLIVLVAKIAADDSSENTQVQPTTSMATNTQFRIDPSGYTDPNFPAQSSENLIYPLGHGIVIRDIFKEDSKVIFYVYYTDPESLAVRKTEEITVILDENHSANFNWKDRWDNSGTGSIKFTNEPEGQSVFVGAYLTIEESYIAKDKGFSLDTTNKKLTSVNPYYP